MDASDDNHWAELNPDLLEEIVKHVNYGDHARSRTVCKNWSLQLPKNSKHPKNPWLVLPSKNKNEIGCSLYSLGENIVYDLELPEMQKTILRGSCYGWLITVAIDGALRILNPFTRAQFDLPPLSTFPDVPDWLGGELTLMNLGGGLTLMNLACANREFNIEKMHMQSSQVWKIVISAPPSHDDQEFVAMALYGDYRRLAWCRIVDSRWTDVPSAEIRCEYEDAIFHEGKMYVIDDLARLFEFDMKTELRGIIESIPSNLPNLQFDDCMKNRKYLIGTSDGLLMVIRRLKNYPKHIIYDDEEYRYCYRTFGFEIYKLSRDKWLKMNSIGNYVILLGQNSSLCISPDNFPDGMGNQIYFTDDYIEFHSRQRYGGHDIGVFNLEDGSIRHLYPDEHSIWPPPIWLLL